MLYVIHTCRGPWRCIEKSGYSPIQWRIWTGLAFLIVLNPISMRRHSVLDCYCAFWAAWWNFSSPCRLSSHYAFDYQVVLNEGSYSIRGRYVSLLVCKINEREYFNLELLSRYGPCGGVGFIGYRTLASCRLPSLFPLTHWYRLFVLNWNSFICLYQTLELHNLFTE